MSRTLATLLTGLVLISATALSANPAQAQSAPSAPANQQIEIAFEDGDLIDPVRLDALEARIEAAAVDLCRDQLLGDLLRPVTLRACIRETTARALDQLDSHRRAAIQIASNAADDQG